MKVTWLEGEQAEIVSLKQRLRELEKQAWPYEERATPYELSPWDMPFFTPASPKRRWHLRWPVTLRLRLRWPLYRDKAPFRAPRHEWTEQDLWKGELA